MITKIKKYVFNIYLFFTQGTLLSLTNKEIHKDYPFLYKRFGEKLWKNLASSKSYKYIILVTIFLVAVCYVITQLKWFTWINLELSTAKGIVDQRTSNIASIISISLAIAVFLLNNLALKKYYDLIFRETLIYPTVYFSFIVLGFLVVLSVLKDDLDPVLFCNLVILFHFLIILVIAAIAILFSKIIKVFNPDYLRPRLKSALIEATKEIILSEEQRIASTQIYKNKLKNVIPFPLGMYLENKYTISLEFSPNKNIKDVKINSLVKIIKKIKKKDRYKEDIAGYDLSLNYDLRWGMTIMKIPDSFKSYEKKIMKCFKIGTYSEHKLSFNSLNKELLKDILSAIKEDNEDEVGKILSGFFFIYEEYFKYIKHKNELKSIEIPNDYIRYLRFDMVEIFEYAIKKGNAPIVQRILEFFNKLIREAYFNNAFDVFESYISFSEDIYKWSVKNEHLKNVAVNEWTRKLIDFYKYFLKSGIDKEKKQIDRFVYSYHNYFAQYLYSILNQFNYDDFQKVYSKYSELLSYYDSESEMSEAKLLGNEEQLKNLKESYTKKFYSQILFNHVNIALQSWFYYKYQVKLFESNESKSELIDIFKKFNYLFNARHFSSRGLIYEYTELINSDRFYLKLNDWGNDNNHEDGEVYTLFPSKNWLKLGFTVMALKHHNDLSYTPFDLPIDTSARIWGEFIENNFKLIEDNLDEWKEFIEYYDKDTFDYAKEKILNFINGLNRRYEANIEMSIHQQDISSMRLKVFKDGIASIWRKNSGLITIFENVNALETESNSSDVKYIGINTFGIGFKMMFVDEHHSYINGINDLGGKAGRALYVILFNQANSFKKAKVYKNVKDGLSKSFEILKEQNIEPNLVLIGSQTSFFNEFRGNNEGFQYIHNSEGNSIYFGKYKGVNIASSFADNWNKYVIVCNLNKAFVLELNENEDWIDKRLFVDVELINDEKAKQLLEKEPEKWKKDGKGIELSDEEALIKIKNSVTIKIGVNANFKNLNSDAFEIFTIEEQ